MDESAPFNHPTFSPASEKMENLLKGRSGSKSCCVRLPARLLECLYLADQRDKECAICTQINEH